MKKSIVLKPVDAKDLKELEANRRNAAGRCASGRCASGRC